MQTLVRQKSTVQRANLCSQTYSWTQHIFCKFKATLNFASPPVTIFSFKKFWATETKSWKNILVCQNCSLRIREIPWMHQPILFAAPSYFPLQERFEQKSWQIISSQTRKFLWKQIWEIISPNYTLILFFVNIC